MSSLSSLAARPCLRNCLRLGAAKPVFATDSHRRSEDPRQDANGAFSLSELPESCYIIDDYQVPARKALPGGIEGLRPGWQEVKTLVNEVRPLGIT